MDAGEGGGHSERRRAEPETGPGVRVEWPGKASLRETHFR